MAMNPVLALINCDSEDKFVRDIAEAYFQNPIHVRDLLTEDCIEACLDDYMRNQDVIADVRDLSFDCNNEAKLSAKQRRAVRIERNKQKKGSDRAHGKHARDVRKAIREDTADWDDMPNNTYFRWDEKRKTFTSPKMPKIHRVKRTFRDRMDAATHDRLNDVSPVERLTASVLAHMSNHVFMWDEQIVYDLTEALCEEYRQVFPDDSYVCVYGNHVNLYMQYIDENGILQDEQCYTLR